MICVKISVRFKDTNREWFCVASKITALPLESYYCSTMASLIGQKIFFPPLRLSSQ